MNKLVVFLMAVISVNLFAYSDYDMDGVDDKIDQCPNTSLSELVDVNGCTIKNLQSPHNYDIVLGVNFSQVVYDGLEKRDTLTETLQVDYYYKNLSLQASTSYYSYDEKSGMNDSFLGMFYKLAPAENLSVRFGGGISIPTYESDLDNNNLDYSASANISYTFKSVTIFGGYNFTIINDNNTSITYDDSSTAKITYQDTNSYSVGIGFYPTSKLYISTSYNSSDNIYKYEDKIDTASIYTFYSINSNWFLSLAYAYGLSDTASDNYTSFRLGYYF